MFSPSDPQPLSQPKEFFNNVSKKSKALEKEREVKKDQALDEHGTATFVEIKTDEFMIQTNLPHAGKHFFVEDEINSDIEE